MRLELILSKLKSSTWLQFFFRHGRIRRDHLPILIGIIGIIFIGLTLGLIQWTDRFRNHPEELLISKPQVLQEGVVIQFDERSPSLKLIETLQTQKAPTTLRVVAPARITATLLHQKKGSAPVVLFESTDSTALYSQYLQSRANFERASRNHIRVKHMFDNELATAKELNDAEAEFMTSQAAQVEFAVKLRAEGFTPSEMENLSSKTAWMIADVPEGELQEVEKGEEVRVTLTSFPDRIFIGKADAIGDMIDPATRTVKVRVSIPNLDEKIKPGMYGRADFGAPQNAVLAIPLSAVVTVEEQSYVFVAQPKAELGKIEFERRPIFLMHSHSTEGIVLKGLKEGEKIAISGAILLKGLSFGY